MGLFAFQRIFQKTWKRAHHVLPSGAKPCSTDDQGRGISKGWECHCGPWEVSSNSTFRSSVSTEKVRDAKTMQLQVSEEAYPTPKVSGTPFPFTGGQTRPFAHLVTLGRLLILVHNSLFTPFICIAFTRDYDTKENSGSWRSKNGRKCSFVER